MLARRGDAVEEDRVMQRSVPRGLEPVEDPVLPGDLQVLAGKEAEGEDGNVVIVVVEAALWRWPYAAYFQGGERAAEFAGSRKVKNKKTFLH